MSEINPQDHRDIVRSIEDAIGNFRKDQHVLDSYIAEKEGEASDNLIAARNKAKAVVSALHDFLEAMEKLKC